MGTGGRSSEHLDHEAGVVVLRLCRLSALWRVPVHDPALTVELGVVVQSRANPNKNGVVHGPHPALLA